MASILALPAGACLVEWPNLHFECRRAAMKQQQACMLSPDVSATKESGRSWKDRQQSTDRRGGPQPHAPPVPGDPAVHDILQAKHHACKDCKGKKGGRQEFIQQGSPSPLHSGTLIPAPGGCLSLLCRTEGRFQLLKHLEVVHLGRCAEHRLTTATPSCVCLNSVVQSHNSIVLIGLGLTDPPASASRALGLTVCATMPTVLRV